MKILAQSCPKPDNDIYDNGKIRQNEDVFVINYHENTLFAVSDGAGGSGIFASDWAKTLLENLPKEVFKNVEDLDAWIGEFWEEFYHKQQDFIQKMEDKFLQSLVKTKFQEEGSNATLLSVWIEAENKINCVTFGDSTFILYDKETKKCEFFVYNSLEEYENNPFLLNFLHETPKQGFFKKEFQISNQKTLYLVTDAVAQYLHCAYLAQENPKLLAEISQKPLKISQKAKTFLEELEKFKNQEENTNFNANFFENILKNLNAHLENQESFENFLNNEYQKGLILRDDYTCVMLDFG